MQCKLLIIYKVVLKLVGRYFNRDSMICLDQDSSGSSLCRGDSGGPIYCTDEYVKYTNLRVFKFFISKLLEQVTVCAISSNAIFCIMCRNGRLVVVGLNSFVMDHCKYPKAAANVVNYLDWIAEKVALESRMDETE